MFIISVENVFEKPYFFVYPYRQFAKTISQKRADISESFSRLFPDFAIFGRDSEAFPEILLGHNPNLRNFKFYLKS